MSKVACDAADVATASSVLNAARDDTLALSVSSPSHHLYSTARHESMRICSQTKCQLVQQVIHSARLAAEIKTFHKRKLHTMTKQMQSVSHGGLSEGSETLRLQSMYTCMQVCNV